MESTAQYWKPVWETLERYWKPIREKREDARRRSGTLHLAQALSNRGRRGRKRDFLDAERLVKRLVARELILSFVPDAEQRLWRTVTRKKYQLRCDRARQNRVEALLEEAHIKLSSLVSDLLGLSARRMLKALAEGETNPAALAALADERLRATPEQLCDALGACTELNGVYRKLLRMALEQLQPQVTKRQPPHAALNQSGCQRRRKGQRKHLRSCLSPFGPAPRTQSSHRSHCPSTVSPHLVDPASGTALRRARPSGH